MGGLPRRKEILEVSVTDAELAMEVLAETSGAAEVVAVPGGVRIAGIALGVVVHRLVCAGVEIADINKVTMSLEDIFAAQAQELTDG